MNGWDLCWNAGGLSLATWDGLQLWLQKQHIDVVMIQETHWTVTSEWTSDEWICIHSAASPSKTGGLLTMLSKRLPSAARCGPCSTIPWICQVNLFDKGVPCEGLWDSSQREQIAACLDMEFVSGRWPESNPETLRTWKWCSVLQSKNNLIS